MNGTVSIVTIILAGLLSDNLVLSKLIGVCPFLDVSKKVSSALYVGITVTLVMVLTAVVTWPVHNFLLYPNFTYFETLVFILLILITVKLTEILLKHCIKPLYKVIGKYLPLVATNCAVLGITLLNTTSELGFLKSLANAFFSGLGFTLALLLFSGVRKRLETADVPKFLKGLPITLIAAAIVSLAFLGFSR